MMKRRFGSSSPMECRPLTNVPSRAMRSSAGRPMRVMMDMLMTTYALSVISTPQREYGRVDGPHAVRHHVQRPALHAALEQVAHFRARLVGRHPVVVRAGVVAVLRADEGQVLDARHVRRVGVGDVAAREGSLVELLELAGLLERLFQACRVRQASHHTSAPCPGVVSWRTDSTQSATAGEISGRETNDWGAVAIAVSFECLPVLARQRSIAAKNAAAISVSGNSMNRLTDQSRTKSARPANGAHRCRWSVDSQRGDQAALAAARLRAAGALRLRVGGARAWRASRRWCGPGRRRPCRRRRRWRSFPSRSGGMAAGDLVQLAAGDRERGQ